MQSKRKLQLLLRLRVDPEIQIRLADGVPYRRLHLGMLVKVSGNLCRCPIKRCSYLQVGIRIRGWPRFVGKTA